MSYDLAVFDPRVAPNEYAAFLSWFEEQIDSSAGRDIHAVNDPETTTEPLRAWFHEMRVDFPAMNGPYKPDPWPRDDAAVSDYGFYQGMIYVNFAWSKAEDACQAASALAASHRVGFFEPQANEVWVPDGGGKLVRVGEG